MIIIVVKVKYENGTSLSSLRLWQSVLKFEILARFSLKSYNAGLLVLLDTKSQHVPRLLQKMNVDKLFTCEQWIMGMLHTTHNCVVNENEITRKVWFQTARIINSQMVNRVERSFYWLNFWKICLKSNQIDK